MNSYSQAFNDDRYAMSLDMILNFFLYVNDVTNFLFDFQVDQRQGKLDIQRRRRSCHLRKFDRGQTLSGKLHVSVHRAESQPRLYQLR